MKRSLTILFAVLSAAICLSCSAISADKSIRVSGWNNGYAANQQVDNVPAAAQESRVWFQNRTQEIVDEALTLIERNEREGAPLDQQWYAFRRFGENLEHILRAREVRFYGGREADVRSAIASHYVSLIPFKVDQDPGDIRLFTARQDRDSFDIVIIGQNGREVALKTMIRLVYLFKFMKDKIKPTLDGGLDSFVQRVKVFLSSITPQQEFISFFHQYGIGDPDAVVIGFQSDTRLFLKEAGIGDPERFSSDSLRINWYPNANGKKVLLVSINGNRIFASRAGDLIEAIFETFRSPPQSLVFFGSAGAIDATDLVGQIVAPTVVVNDDYFNPDRPNGKLVHIIRNRAATIVPVKTAHVSVKSIVVETMKWAAANKRNRIRTVDQELFHVINAINASPYGDKIQLFVGILVTDNVSVVQAHDEATLQYAEEIITQTAAIRRAFLAKVLAEIGIARDMPVTTPSDTKTDERRNSAASGG